MAMGVVWVALVVDLEAERVLQEVARLFVAQPGHDGRPLRDAYDLKRVRLGQHAGYPVYVFRGRHPMGGGAPFELAQRADVAEFPDTNVPVVVRQVMRVGDRTRGLAE